MKSEYDVVGFWRIAFSLFAASSVQTSALAVDIKVSVEPAQDVRERYIRERIAVVFAGSNMDDTFFVDPISENSPAAFKSEELFSGTYRNKSTNFKRRYTTPSPRYKRVYTQASPGFKRVYTQKSSAYRNIHDHDEQS